MSEPTFNLVDKGWIPVQGERDLQSLKQIFTRKELGRLSGNPVEKISVLRLLLALTQTAIALPDHMAWQQLTLDDLADKVLVYLGRWHDRFDLYGSRPFMQFPQLARGKTTPFSAAQPYVATGNKVILNSWNQETPTEPPGQAMALLRQSFYACGGKRFDNDLVLSQGLGEKKPSGAPGVLTGFKGYLHTYLLGDTILGTIKNNLLTDEDIRQLPFSGLGQPCWEEMPDGEVSQRALDYKSSYLGQLMPLDKFVLLLENGMVMTEGIPYETYKTGLVDPALTIFQGDKDVKTVWAETEKRPWRELTALLSFLKVDATHKSPHFLSMGLEKLSSTPNTVARFWTGGMQLSNNAGEQYLSGMDDYVESEFHIPLTLSTRTGFDFFQKMISDLERYSKVAYASVKSYFIALNNDQKDSYASMAAGRFWEAMEPRAQIILDLAFAELPDREQKIEEEMKLWEEAVLHIYNHFCAKDTARQMTAWVKAAPNFSTAKKRRK